MNTNATKTASKTTALIALAVSALAIPSAHAVNPTFVAGDLVLFFQQFGGPAFPMMVDLGAATLYRDGYKTPNQCFLRH